MSAKRNLAKARKVRHQIGAEMRLVSSGVLSLYEVLEHPSDALKRVTIYDLMRRAPKLGPDGAKHVLQDTKVWPHDRVGNIPLNERRKILEALPDRVRQYYNRAA